MERSTARGMLAQGHSFFFWAFNWYNLFIAFIGQIADAYHLHRKKPLHEALQLTQFPIVQCQKIFVLPPRRVIYFAPLLPQEIPGIFSYIASKNFLFNTPLPRGISNDLPSVDMDFLWNYIVHIDINECKSTMYFK